MIFLYQLIGRTVSIAFIVFSICFIAAAQNNTMNTNDYGKLYVTRWADDKESAFSFSFDDGYISHYENVRTILNEYGFNSAHYILPLYLTNEPPGIYRYGTWPMFIEMFEEGFELGSHSLNHPHLKQLDAGDTLTPNTIHYELYHSRKMINERTNSFDCITFAYPFAEHDDLIDSLTSIYYESARGLGMKTNSSSPSGIEWFSLNSYEVQFDEPRNIPEDDLDELYDFMNWIEEYISEGRWGIQLAHEVVPYEELADLISQGAWYPISNEWMTELCDWLYDKSSNDQIWLETVMNVTKYIKERDSHFYLVTSLSDSLIEVELSDTLNNNIYNYPLTAYISIPAEWEKVLVHQGSNNQIVESFNIDSMQVVMADVTPDGGIIRLTKYIPSFVDEETDHPDDFILYQNYPNPFNPATVISWQLPASSSVKLKIYDILGNEMMTLIDEEQVAGHHKINFSASGGDVYNLSSGIYIYVLRAGDRFISRKMTILK